MTKNNHVKLSEIFHKTMKLSHVVRGSAIWAFSVIVDDLQGVDNPVHINPRISRMNAELMEYRNDKEKHIKRLRDEEIRIHNNLIKLREETDSERRMKESIDKDNKRKIEEHANKVRSIIEYSQSIDTEIKEVENSFEDYRLVIERCENEKKQLSSYYETREMDILNRLKEFEQNQQRVKANLDSDNKSSRDINQSINLELENKDKEINDLRRKVDITNSKNQEAKNFIQAQRGKHKELKTKYENMMRSIRVIRENSTNCPPVIRTLTYIEASGSSNIILDEKTLMISAVKIINV